MVASTFTAVPKTPMQRHRLRLAELDSLYKGRGWEGRHRELVDYLLPGAGRFVPETDHSRGDTQYSHLLNMRAIEALQVGVSGMLAGTSSPSRPWFNIGLLDKELAKRKPVRQWLYDVRQLILEVLARSNSYAALAHTYEQILAFGTSANICWPNFENVVHHHPLTVGEYRLATDELGRVDTLIRRYVLTVAQLEQRFGIDNASQRVKNAWSNGRLNEHVVIVHLIEPRAHADPRSRLSKEMAFGSYYWEESRDSAETYLLETGLRRNRILAPRWKVTGTNVYGEGPGMWALGHVKGLQHKELRKAEAIDYQTKPPLVAPASMAGMELDLLPGGISYTNGLGSDGIKEMFKASIDLTALREDIALTEQAIDKLFFRDLFMLVTQSERAMTAYEVAKRYEEKLLVLGPTLDRLHNELHAPLIDIVFEDLMHANALPPIPEELDDQEISVEFISPLAQAQRLVGMQAIERLLGLTFQIAAGGRVDALDVIDTDVVLEDAVELLGTNPRYLTDPEARAAQRDARAQQAAAAQQAETAATVAGAVRDATSAPGVGQSVTNELAMFSG